MRLERQGVGWTKLGLPTRDAEIRTCPDHSRPAILVQLPAQVFAMKVITYSHARNALKAVLDGVVRDADVTIISRRDAEGDAVVMSLDHYNSLMETLHLLSTPANAEALTRAIRQDREGRAQPRALLDSDGD
jgi:antitoxin YefM